MPFLIGRKAKQNLLKENKTLALSEAQEKRPHIRVEF